MSDTRSSPRRGLDPVAVAAALLWTAVTAVYMAAPLRALLVRVVPDDASFYLVIARNGVSGLLSSFDGFERTNGYHPLWMAVLQVSALVLRAPGALMRGAFAIGLAAYAGAGVVLYRALARYGAAAPGMALAALAVLVLPASWLVTEAPIAVLLFARFVAAMLDEGTGADVRDEGRQQGRGGGDRAGALALWGTLTVLARLDAVFLVVPPLLVRAWDRVRAQNGGVARALLPLVVSGAAVGAYMAVNVAVFGHPMPISGMIKGSFPHVVVPRLGALGRYVRGLPPLAGALGWLAVRTLGWRSPLPRAADRMLNACVIGMIGYYAYEILFQKELAWGVASWHFALATVVLVVLIGLGAARLPLRRATVIAFALLALGAADLWRKLNPASPTDSSLEPLAAAGAWIRDRTEPAAVVAATDPGLVAWLGERRTVALDGLVNTLAYQTVLRDGGLAGYLREREVGYVVVLGPYAPGPDGEMRVPVPSRLYAPAGDTLRLGREPPVFTAAGGGVRIWRYPPPEAPGARP